jgi:hypothetical protein
MKKTLRRFLLAQLVVCSLVIIGCGGDDSGGNQCERAKKVKVDAIRSICEQFPSCGYCSCELSANPGYDCSSFSLVSKEDTSKCEAVDQDNAEGCLNNETGCEEQMQAGVTLRCSLQN